VTSHRRQQLALVIGLTVLAFNLRPTAVSVGPVLNEIRQGLGMGTTTAGVVTTLPVLTFALFGSVAPWLGRRFGMHRVMLTSLLLTAAMLSLRSTVGSPALFIVTTVPALAGMAIANVLLPSLVKLHFPDRIGLVTAIYTTALSIGLTFASVLTVPVADSAGSWRWGLALWGATALVAAAPWLGLLRHDVRPESDRSTSISARETSRAPLAWTMAVFFGAQSMQAYAVFGWLPQIYRDAGFSAQNAGILLGVATAISIPISFVLPSIAVRRTNQAPLILGLCASYAAGYLGLIVWPSAAAVVWALLIGIGTGMFPLVLTLIGLRARTSDGTAALSGFTQSVGYLLAAVGPFMMGALYGATGGWTVPLVVLIGLLVPQAIAGVMVSKPRFLEDEIGPVAVPAAR
jgi:CP family cyanate transporter-like MFS transporter